MRRISVVGTALAVTAASFVLSAPAAQASSAQVSAKKNTPTLFALRTSAYGTRIHGGDIPASSGTTAYRSIGCTNVAGKDRGNDVASAELPGLGELKGVSSRTWTSKKKNTVSSYSRHNVADVVLAQSALGSLRIRAVSSQSRVFHNNHGFHARTHTSVGSISLKPVVGPEINLPIPTTKKPIVIPGLLSIALGAEKSKSNSKGARAQADALIIKILPTDTRVRIAHTGARIFSGVKSGIFHGRAFATQVDALNKLVKSGPQPLVSMPCQGTNGKVQQQSLAAVPLAGLLGVDAATSLQKGKQTKKKARGFEEARIAGINLGDGALVVKAIRARAHVVRTKHKVKSDAHATVGSIKVNGETYSLPDLDGLEIPGLVKIQTNIVKKKKKGIDVVALRLTLLDGTGATVDLGHAKLTIKKTGLGKKKH